MTDTSRELFFFYGSLRTGYWNNRILSKDATLLGPAQTLHGFDLYVGRSGHVPTCCPNPVGRPLHGELWSLNEEDASRVRRLEAGYREGTFRVITDEAAEYEASIYHHLTPTTCWYLGGEPVLIPSGDYTVAIGKDGTDRRAA